VIEDMAQIEPRFPMLSESPIFLPALIDVCRAKGITAMFIGEHVHDASHERVFRRHLEILADYLIIAERETQDENVQNDVRISYIRTPKGIINRNFRLLKQVSQNISEVS